MHIIIFDFGSVLFQVDYWNLYQKYFRTQEEYTYFRTEILTPELRSESHKGNALPMLQKLAAEHPEYSLPILATYYEYEEIITGVIPGMKTLLQKLDTQGVHIYGLTNWAADNYKTLERLHPEILHYMKGVVVSGQEGMKKPNPDFFNTLLSRYNIDPATALFVDDKPKNVETAKQLGMDGIVFKDAQQLSHYLHEKHILTPYGGS